MGLPVARIAAKTSDTLAVGFNCLKIAHAPATCGVAIEVPLKAAKPPPGTEEVIAEPGAITLKKLARSENDEIVSVFVVDPTLTAVDMPARPPTPVTN